MNRSGQTPYSTLLRARMLVVVRRELERPEVGFLGTLATRLVFLCQESDVVRTDLRHILCTGRDCSSYSREAVANPHLVRSGRSGTFDLLSQEQSVTITTRGRRYTVRAEQHLLTAMLSAFTGFTQCAGYGIDTGTPIYFCHSRSAIGSQRPIPLR